MIKKQLRRNYHPIAAVVLLSIEKNYSCFNMIRKPPADEYSGAGKFLCFMMVFTTQF